jgi:hypothetical protein
MWKFENTYSTLFPDAGVSGSGAAGGVGADGGADGKTKASDMISELVDCLPHAGLTVALP